MFFPKHKPAATPARARAAGLDGLPRRTFRMSMGGLTVLGLAAFVAVAACVLVMRSRAPDAPRSFRTPAAWVVAPFAIAGCLYLFWSLPSSTQLYFLLWNLAGLAVYFLYARPRAVAGQVA